MSELESLCIKTLKIWDKYCSDSPWTVDGEIAEAMEKIRLHLALFPPVETRASRKTGSCVLPPLPAFAEPYREHLQSWWEQRKRHHKGNAKNEISRRTIAALEDARKLGVLEEFCVVASEASWLSLGFAGYTEALEKLARDKTFTPSSQSASSSLSARFRGSGRTYQQQSEQDMTNHPAYRPLSIDSAEMDKDVFF